MIEIMVKHNNRHTLSLFSAVLTCLPALIPRVKMDHHLGYFPFQLVCISLLLCQANTQSYSMYQPLPTNQTYASTYAVHDNVLITPGPQENDTWTAVDENVKLLPTSDIDPMFLRGGWHDQDQEMTTDAVRNGARGWPKWNRTRSDRKAVV